MELFKLISIDNKDNNYIKIDDKKMIFKSFLNIVNEKIKDPNLDIDIIFIEIGLNIFGNDFLIFVNEYDFPEVLLLEAFLSKNEKQFNIEFHKKNLELIHTMFESHKSGTPIEKIYNAEQLNLFLIQTIMNPLAINYVLNYIFDTSNWSYKDLEFIKLLLRIFSNSFNTISYIYENSLDKKTFDRFKKVMISFNSKEKLNEENDEFDKRFNLMVKTLKEV